jgi:HEAT repeat protein
MGDPAAIPLLREMYPNTAGYARTQTLLALEEIGAGDLDVVLTDALNDPDDRVRDRAAVSIGADRTRASAVQAAFAHFPAPVQ